MIRVFIVDTLASPFGEPPLDAVSMNRRRCLGLWCGEPGARNPRTSQTISTTWPRAERFAHIGKTKRCKCASLLGGENY